LSNINNRKNTDEIDNLDTGIKFIKSDLLIWRIFSFLVVFSIWEIAGRADISIAFPPFSKVALAFFSNDIFGGIFGGLCR
jgi:ABC-type nitrate/sulfonate/bicarbonate transport system permease component